MEAGLCSTKRTRESAPDSVMRRSAMIDITLQMEFSKAMGCRLVTEPLGLLGLERGMSIPGPIAVDKLAPCERRSVDEICYDRRKHLGSVFQELSWDFIRTASLPISQTLEGSDDFRFGDGSDEGVW